jgi:hypothetical protein
MCWTKNCFVLWPLSIWEFVTILWRAINLLLDMTPPGDTHDCFLNNCTTDVCFHQFPYVWLVRWFMGANYVQGDQKVCVHLMITIQITILSQHTSFLPHYLAQSDCLAAGRQGQEDTRLTLTPSVIPNSNYVTIESDWNCLIYFWVVYLL